MSAVKMNFFKRLFTNMLLILICNVDPMHNISFNETPDKVKAEDMSKAREKWKEVVAAAKSLNGL